MRLHSTEWAMPITKVLEAASWSLSLSHPCDGSHHASRKPPADPVPEPQISNLQSWEPNTPNKLLRLWCSFVAAQNRLRQVLSRKNNSEIRQGTRLVGVWGWKRRRLTLCKGSLVRSEEVRAINHENNWWRYIPCKGLELGECLGCSKLQEAVVEWMRRESRRLGQVSHCGPDQWESFLTGHFKDLGFHLNKM